MSLTPREEKFIELTGTSANLLSLADNQMGISTDTNGTYGVTPGHTVWRANDKQYVGAVQLSKDAVSGNIEYMSNTFGDTTIKGDIDDGMPRNGFNGNMSDVNAHATFTFNNDTRIGVFAFDDARDTDVTCDNTRLIIPDGDARLTCAAIPQANGWYTFYFESNGQLTAAIDPDLSVFTTKCLVATVYYSTTNTGIPAGTHTGAEIAIFKQWHGSASVDWRGNHHNTEGTKIGCCDDFEVTTTSTEGSPTSIINMKAGTVWDEDIGTYYAAINGSTGVWVCFYYEGFADGQLIVKRGTKTTGNLSDPFVLATDAGVSGATTGNIIYNTISYGSNGAPNGATVGEVQDGQYVLAHILTANGTLANNTIVVGQNLYNSITEAREQSSVEVNKVVAAAEIVSEAKHVATVILDNTGSIVPFNNDGLMVADVRERKDKIVFGGTNEVVIPNGDGYLRSTRDISLANITTEDSTTLSHLSDSAGEFAFIGADGIIGSFDLLGSSEPGGSVTTTNTRATVFTTTGSNPPAYQEILSVTVPSGHISSSFTYSIDSFLYSSTKGMWVQTLINGVQYDEELFDGVYSGGTAINISKTIAGGALAAGNIVSVKIKTNKNWQTCTAEVGSFLSVIGQTAASAGDSHFILSENGVGTGTHVFDQIGIGNDSAVYDLDILSSGNARIQIATSNSTGYSGVFYETLSSGIHSYTLAYGPTAAQANEFSIKNTIGDITFYTGNPVNSERVVIKSTGKVGILNSTPSTALDVTGVITATGGNSTEWNTGYDHSLITTGNPHSLNLADIGESNASINYWTLSGSNVYRTTGNVGIGTSNPLTPLHTIGTVRADNGAGIYTELRVNDLNFNGSDGYISTATAGSDLIFRSGASAEAMRIDGNGDVGIGTASPARKLHVEDTGTVLSLIKSSDNTTSSLSGVACGTQASDLHGLFLAYGASHATQALQVAIKNTVVNGAITFYTLDEKMRIAYNGNVGIGTSNPSTKLEINGDLSYTSTPTWTQLGTTGVYYTKRGGIVYLRGTNTHATATALGTLPAGYRPGLQVNIPTITTLALSGAAYAGISTGGTLASYHFNGAATSVSFDGVSFIAEN